VIIGPGVSFFKMEIPPKCAFNRIEGKNPLLFKFNSDVHIATILGGHYNDFEFFVNAIATQF